MNRSRIIIISLIAVGTATFAALAGWLYYLSLFQTVTFTFDEADGQAQLINLETGEHDITPGEPMKVKKGEYTLTQFGENIQSESRVVEIDADTDEIAVSFRYTSDFLTKTFARERSAIRAALQKEYPQLKTLYTISHEAVYEKGQFYGATLTFKDRKSEQRDTLRVLMQKQDDEWQVRSTPPQPVLSAPTFTDVHPATLEAINRAK